MSHQPSLVGARLGCATLLDAAACHAGVAKPKSLSTSRSSKQANVEKERWERASAGVRRPYEEQLKTNGGSKYRDKREMCRDFVRV